MIRIEQSQPHHLPYPEARKRAEAIAMQFGEKYKLTWRWDASTIRFTGHGVDGFIVVGTSVVRIVVDLPPMLFGLQGVIASGIKDHLKKLVQADPLPS